MNEEDLAHIEQAIRDLRPKLSTDQYLFIVQTFGCVLRQAFEDFDLSQFAENIFRR